MLTIMAENMPTMGRKSNIVYAKAMSPSKKTNEERNKKGAGWALVLCLRHDVSWENRKLKTDYMDALYRCDQ